MLFTTGKYWLFLTIVFFVYWSVARRRSLRVIVILLASYYFYALWNPAFVPLLFGLSTIDFLTARGISLTTRPRLRRALLITSTLPDVGPLIVSSTSTSSAPPPQLFSSYSTYSRGLSSSKTSSFL